MSDRASGFERAVAALSEAGVGYVIVGVGGINFYARTPAEAYATLDLDALLEPSAGNLRIALRVLAQLDYAFESRREPFVDLDDEFVLGAIVRNGTSLSAIHSDVGEIDLLLSVAGHSYDDLASDAVEFRVAEAVARVGALDKLLSSKRASGRPRDLEFLRAFEARAAEGDEDA